jgi:hypothetical protein
MNAKTNYKQRRGVLRRSSGVAFSVCEVARPYISAWWCRTSWTTHPSRKVCGDPVTLTWLEVGGGGEVFGTILSFLSPSPPKS